MSSTKKLERIVGGGKAGGLRVNRTEKFLKPSSGGLDTTTYFTYFHLCCFTSAATTANATTTTWISRTPVLLLSYSL